MRARTRQARIPQGPCGRCGDMVQPGGRYWFAKPRYGAKMIRCDKPECRFRPSDLTTSKMSGAYAAQEGAEDAIAGAGTVEDIKDALTACAEGFREVAEEYRAAAEAWEHETSQTAEWNEKADELDGAADELDSAADDMDNAWEDAKSEHADDMEADGDGLDEEQTEAAMDTMREQGTEALANVSLP